MKKEKELKTLKDIEKDTEMNYWLGKIIRAEAIKWVKEYFPNNPAGEIFGIRDFMEFHNITEEDLK